MLIRFNKLITGILAAGLSQSTLAHIDGVHDMSLLQGLLHFFGDPAHLLIAVVSLVLAYLGARIITRRFIKARSK